jgi:hypothetical protein
LIGRPVQQAGQRTPSPICVGDKGSRSVAIVLFTVAQPHHS